MKRIDVTK
ncbi:unnamed protein product, partial [Rotaria magnacalcarata]